MKFILTLCLALTPLVVTHATEQGLTRTVQPLDGGASGEILLAPVMCWDWNAMSSFPTAIPLITTKNIPPTNSPKPVEDVNVASVCGLALSFDEDAQQHLTVTLDCRALHTSTRFGSTEQEIVAATLECLRQVEGDKLDKMTLKVTINPKGQAWIQEMMDRFIKHPKDKEFPWKAP